MTVRGSGKGLRDHQTLQNQTESNLAKQVALFIFFGGLQLVVEYLVFVLLTYFGINIAFSNIAGRIGGALLGFKLNLAFTFKRREGVDGTKAIGRFLVSWVLFTLLGTTIMSALGSRFQLSTLWVVKPFVDALLAAMSFLVAKLWIYTAKK